jgi:putative phosphoesterase
MKIGIISDTHSNLENVKKAIGIFNKNQVGYIFHAGDIVSPITAMAFAEAGGAKFIAIFGNCDNKQIDLRKVIEGFGGEIHERFYSGQVGGRGIYMSHSPPKLEEVTNSGRYNLVIYGHTHKQDIRWIGNVLIVNPGPANNIDGGDGCVVILDSDDMTYEIISL